MRKWICVPCGFIYDPDENESIPFEELPDDWVCPWCGANKDEFEIYEE